MSLLKENPRLILENIKKLLNLGVKNRYHAFHTPVFSNINEKNYSNSRIVVLRNFDKLNMILSFHTDYRSPKLKELKNNNKSIFVFYDSKLKIQLRIKTLSKINNQNNITKISWLNTSPMSRKCYLTRKAPSSVSQVPEDGIPGCLISKEPSKKDSEKGYKNFAVIENKIEEIDWLYLASTGHRRLKIYYKNNSTSFNWLIP